MDAAPTPWIRSDRVLAWTARSAWLVLLVVMSVVHARRVAEPGFKPISRTYEQASAAWWAHRDLYAPISSFHGYLYLPSAAIAYTPFTPGPQVVRDLAERLAFALLLVAGLAALARIGDPRRRGGRFLILTLATLPLAVQNFRQGQMNLVLVGAMLLATAALATRRWGWAAVALVFGVAMKPLALLLVLLAGAAYPRTLGWRLAVGTVAVLLLPFAFGPPAYVLSQYGDFLHKMQVTSAPTTHYYELRGLLETGFGIHPSASVMTVLRALAGLGALAAALLVRRRFDLERAAPYLYCLWACYVLLFNPKTEDPTYLLLGPAVGYLAVELFFVERQRLHALLLLLIPLLAATSYELLGGRRYWFRPALALVFLAFLLARLLYRPPVGAGSSTAAPDSAASGELALPGPVLS